MEKKKILFVVHHLTIGGVQKSLISALNAMDYNKYDITLYVQKNRTVLLPYVNKNVKIVVNESKKSYYRKPYSVLLQGIIAFCGLPGLKAAKEKYSRKLVEYINDAMMSDERDRYFKNEKFDAAVAYAALSEAPFVAEYIEADRKIVCFQGSTIDRPDMQPVILPLFDKVVVEDGSIKEMLTDSIPPLKGKISIIENYTDSDFILRQADEYTVDTPESVPVLCTVGRMAYIKGFDLAAQAAAILKESGKKFRWYFVGDGPEREAVQKIVEDNGLQHDVIFAGMQKNPYPYFSICDIFVQPSREEAMSIAALESQVLHKPLVTTATVGGMNICKDGETGIVTEISAEGLADGITKLLEDRDLMNKISANLQLTDFGKEKERYKKQWDEILEEI